MKTIEKIKNYFIENKSASGIEIANHLGITRQAVNKHLKLLIQRGEVQKTGNTKAAIYYLSGTKLIRTVLFSFRKVFKIKNLNEDSVFQEIEIYLNLNKKLRHNVFEVVRYALTEMLNNAIDHSESDRCLINVQLDHYNIHILIRDYGIGIFYSIYTKFKLDDEYEAVGELLKGKTTTMREKHSGEGIFFTSKAVDKSTFRSHKTKLIFDTKGKDVLIEEQKFINGTEVSLTISRNSRKKIGNVFNQFAPEEFEYSFQRTKVYIKLYLQNLVSRAEARRMLSGLDKFKEIILDFSGVQKIGQGFADEVFRVFLNKNPDIVIRTENVLPAVRQMIKHVVDNKFNI
jgi:anti-sigma regulatory factor (Ser/Thr protein kinase)